MESGEVARAAIVFSRLSMRDHGLAEALGGQWAARTALVLSPDKGGARDMARSDEPPRCRLLDRWSHASRRCLRDVREVLGAGSAVVSRTVGRPGSGGGVGHLTPGGPTTAMPVRATRVSRRASGKLRPFRRHETAVIDAVQPDPGPVR